MAIHNGCHLILVSGAKGGVGKSVFAANLALALLLEMRSKVLLIDLDKGSCGDLNILTGLKPLKTAMEIANLSTAITPQSLPSLVTPHPSGLHFIGAVTSPDQIVDVSPELFRKQLYSLSQHYQFIVVDIGHTVGDLELALTSDASALMMVLTSEVLALNQARRYLQNLLSATIPLELVQIVANMFSKSSLPAQSITQALRLPVIGLIPDDEATVMNSIQRSQPFVLTTPQAAISVSYHDLARKLTGGVLQRLKALAKPQAPIAKANSPGAMGAIAGATEPAATGIAGRKSRQQSPTTKLKLQIHSELIKEMDLKKDLMKTSGDPAKEKELKNKTLSVISQLTDRMGQGLAREERSRIIKEVLDESLGLGPLEELLADPKVSEIMVNGCDHIYVERSGKLTLSDVTFTSNLQLRNIIERIVTPLGRRIDEKTPYVDARLQDGSRVNAVIEPLSIDGPAITIRKFPKDRVTVENYYTWGSMTKEMGDFLKICVEEGLNVIISGGTGSGKTTLLNVLSGFIPVNERIITVEDAAELQLKQEHVVRLETRPPNMEGTGEVTIRDLIKNSLRMRPDRIVVGECRDGAALDMLSAMNTGHDGSMTTVHANTPREAISRLETLVMMAGMELPAKAIREQIAGAVDMIVQIGRLSDGTRKILSLTEVVGMQGETITLTEIFRFKEEGFDKNRKIIGRFQATGLIPTFIEKFEQRGVSIPRNIFSVTPESQTPQNKEAPSSGLRMPNLGPRPAGASPLANPGQAIPMPSASTPSGTTTPLNPTNPLTKKVGGG